MTLRPQHVAPELLNKVTKALGITALDQWYYVSHYAATQAIGSRALNQCGGTLAGFLKQAFPQHQFDEEKLISRRRLEQDQKFVEVIVRQLFPNTEIQTKARKAVGIINPETDAYLEIDFWLPSLKLGIEYQDKHHFGYQWYANDSLKDYQKRDDIKKETMLSLGYTLITIGYWWDKTPESLAATIRKFRPDLLQEYETHAEPIPSEPPLGHVNEAPVIPGIAGLMSPFIPGIQFNPINWYAGEKHDGIRGVYNPKLNKMFSRSGNELSVLDSLLKDIPDILVEGEITAGRGNYNKTGAVSFHTHHDKVNWPLFRYFVFDIPDAELGNYTQRYSVVTNGLTTRPFIFSQSSFRVLIADKTHLKMLVDAIISDFGEGVIAQKDAPYEYGRAKGLAKIKVRRDADAQVLRINKRSCTCKLAGGITADITFSDDFDPSILKTGDIVSYYHNGYSQSGLPKRAEIYKVRYDISSKELLDDKVQTTTKRRLVKEALGSSALTTSNIARIKKGHWNKARNIRAFFDELARTAGFDPLVPENWYPITIKTVIRAGGGGLLSAYNNIVKKVLKIAYPELQFEMNRFRTSYLTKGGSKKKYGFWNKAQNVRAFFDQFARKTRFNPLVVENWYPVRVMALRNAGGSGMIGAYSNIQKALSHAYPELSFEEEMFVALQQTKAKKGHWSEPSNVRAFFDELANTAGFDPLVPENWDPVRHSTLQKAGGSGLLGVFSYNIKKALSFGYPEVKFDGPH